MRLHEVFLLLCCMCSVASPAKILGVWPMASYSHFTLGNRLMRELASRGHEVTFVSAYKDKNPPKNYKDLTLIGLEKKMEEMKKEMNFFDMVNTPHSAMMVIMFQMGIDVAEDVLSNPAMQELLKSNETFDLILIEQFLNDALRGLQHHYKAPCILVSSMGTTSMINYIVANPSPVSYISDLLLAFEETDMSFNQRLTNVVYTVAADLFQRAYVLPKHNSVMQKYFPDAPHLYDILYDTPMILLNSHISTSRPVPLAPNMVEIGGYHVFPPKKLPEHLQTYLDDAKEGVILFSMGSNLKSKDLPEDKRNALLKAFGKLKQRVLWKWEESDISGKPDNVKIEKWLPQQDILAHKNVKLFITHGGLLSTTEAIYHGVPVIGIPIFGDQQGNMGLAKAAGYGIRILYKDISESVISAAINEVLGNPKYRENIKLRQKLHHDRSMTAIDTAMYSIEYVLRNPGSEIYRSPGTRITWYQAYLLDVIGTLLFITIFSISMLVFVYRKLRSIFCNKKTSKLKNAKNVKKD